MDFAITYGGHIRLTPTLDAPMEEIMQGAHAVFNNAKAAPPTAKAWIAPMVAQVEPKLRQLLLRERGIVMLRLNLANAVYACSSEATIYIVFRTAGAGISCHRLLLRFQADVEKCLAHMRPLMANETETAQLIMNTVGAAAHGHSNHNTTASPKGHRRRHQQQQQQAAAGPALVITPAAVATATAAEPSTHNHHHHHHSPPPAQRRTTFGALFGRRSPEQHGPEEPADTNKAALAALVMNAATPGSTAAIDPKARDTKELREQRRHTSSSLDLSNSAATSDQPLYDVRTMANLCSGSLSLDSGCGTEASAVRKVRKPTHKKVALSRSLQTLTSSATPLTGGSDSDGEAAAEDDGVGADMSISPSTNATDDDGLDDLDDNAVNMTPLDELRQQPYYAGPMSWEDAVIRLGPLDQGCFLVRATAADEQDFVISVINQHDRVTDLRILCISGKYFVTGHASASFHAVPALVAHHMQHRTILSGCVLRTPLSNN